MQFSLLTPTGAVIALVALVPLLALALTEARARRVRRALGLRRPRRGTTILLVAAVAVAGLLVGAVAAQPVLERGATQHERTDVNAYVVIDSTRSMLAAPTRRSANRIARSRELAQELRESVPELKVGLASMTDRVLPHLFPTLDEDVFAATLEHSIGIEQPPPGKRRQNSTLLSSLEQLGPQGFFPVTPERRIVVVFSDFETDPFSSRKLGALLRRHRLELVLVHVWSANERIHGGLGDAGYRPDGRSRLTVRNLASAAAGRSFDERDAEGAAAAVRALVGDGPRKPLWKERSRTELAPWLSLAALVPLGFVLYRRNL
ncbi:MAG: hypothetical protein M3R12_09970 [Actinomycetota bacterium]|nr:hypothetical protein [Actinomycetota bacterium]